jgi:hypothetical protein
MTDALRDKLIAEIETISFPLLAAHAARDGLFLVGDQVPLVEVALAVVRNDTVAVEKLVEAGALRRPNADELMRFDRDPEAHTFRFIIVQPFVLAQLLS